MVKRSLLWITIDPFHFYDFDVILGTEDKGQNIITKDALIALMAQEIPGVLRAVSQEPETNTKYIFLIINQAS